MVRPSGMPSASASSSSAVKRPLCTLPKAMTQAPVSGGVSPTVPLIAGAGFCYPAAETERLTTRICLDGPLRAPVPAGKTVGAAVFCLNGTEIGRVSLVAGRTVMPKVSSALAGLKLELKDE